MLQDHWLRRLIAIVIDFAISLVIAFIISIFVPLPALGIPLLGTTFNLLQGLIFILYTAVLESTWGAPFGMQLMRLRVTTTDGRNPALDRALIRDVSKIHGVVLLIDTVVGMATAGDPHQKITDRYAGTTVVSTIQRSMILPAPYAPPAPAPPTS